MVSLKTLLNPTSDTGADRLFGVNWNDLINALTGGNTTDFTFNGTLTLNNSLNLAADQVIWLGNGTNGSQQLQIGGTQSPNAQDGRVDNFNGTNYGPSNSDEISFAAFAKDVGFTPAKYVRALYVFGNAGGNYNVGVGIPHFLSIGEQGVSGVIEFGPDSGGEATIRGSGGSGSGAFHLIYRVKNNNSAHFVGIPTTGGFWRLQRSNDSFQTTQPVVNIDSTSVITLYNTTSVPSDTPSSGGYIYVDSGALKFKGSSGTVTTLASA